MTVRTISVVVVASNVRCGACGQSARLDARSIDLENLTADVLADLSHGWFGYHYAPELVSVEVMFGSQLRTCMVAAVFE